MKFEIELDYHTAAMWADMDHTSFLPRIRTVAEQIKAQLPKPIEVGCKVKWAGRTSNIPVTTVLAIDDGKCWLKECWPGDRNSTYITAYLDDLERVS